MPSVAAAVLAALALLVATQSAHARSCTDKSGFAAAMAAVDAVPCERGQSHRRYVRAAKRAIGSRLDGPCKKSFVAQYITSSVCGRPAGRFEVCCGNGKTAGKVVRAGKCGERCAAAARSVGEGCTDAGTCVTTSTATSSTTTTTTTRVDPPSCGDGVVNQAGEECDGADLGSRTCEFDGGTLVCTAACKLDASGCTGLRRFSLDFTSGTPGGSCGDIRDDSGTVIRTLACGGLDLGGGVSIVAPGLAPAGSVSRFALACTGSSCAVSPDTTVPPVNTGGPDCTTMGCQFGAPLPIPFASIPALGSCIVSTWAGPASGTLDLASGAATLAIPLASDLHVTGAGLCPRCSAGGSPASPGTGTCNAGARAGQPCTSTNQDGLTRDCLPAANTFVGTISLNLSPATTGAHTASSPTGQFCPEQTLAGAGCFGSPTCRTIAASGTPAGPLAPGAPRTVTLASTFCIPQLDDPTIDLDALPFPGPGAVTLPGTFVVH